MASPDTVIVLIVDYHTAIGARSPVPPPLTIPCAICSNTEPNHRWTLRRVTLLVSVQRGVFSTSDDEFVVEPLWNGTTTTNADAAAAADVGNLYHVVYRRSAVKSASSRGVRHCALRGLYRRVTFLVPRRWGGTCGLK